MVISKLKLFFLAFLWVCLWLTSFSSAYTFNDITLSWLYSSVNYIFPDLSNFWFNSSYYVVSGDNISDSSISYTYSWYIDFSFHNSWFVEYCEAVNNLNPSFWPISSVTLYIPFWWFSMPLSYSTVRSDFRSSTVSISSYITCDNFILSWDYYFYRLNFNSQSSLGLSSLRWGFIWLWKPYINFNVNNLWTWRPNVPDFDFYYNFSFTFDSPFSMYYNDDFYFNRFYSVSSVDCSQDSNYLQCLEDKNQLIWQVSTLSWNLTTCQSDLSSCRSWQDASLLACIDQKEQCESSLDTLSWNYASLENMNSSLSSQLQECLESWGWSWSSALICNTFDLFWDSDNTRYSFPINNNLILPPWYKGFVNEWVLAIKQDNNNAYSIDDEDFQKVMDSYWVVFLYLFGWALFLMFLFVIRKYFIWLKS